jgi:Flp pilus assembly protein TadG
MTLGRDTLANCTGHSGSVHAARGRIRYARAGRQHGAFAIMFAVLLLVMLGFWALAIDLGYAYNRKAELHGVAKAVALAAARELNGTGAGVTAAIREAGATAVRFRYEYRTNFTWSDAAITFGTSPSGSDWVPAETAKALPIGRYYVKVDTSGLDPAAGEVTTFLIQVLSDSTAPIVVSSRAVAGRSSINTTPLAICAMSTDPASARTNPGAPPAILPTVELVEYGFRRGVGYDLMQLNPNNTAPATSFVIDPISQPGASGSASNTSTATVGPFVCTGNMWIPGMKGRTINVSEPFPIGDLYKQLNSRFDQYDDALCDPKGAPPDYNIKQFLPNAAGVGWMSPTPTSQTALSTTEGRKLQTVLDLPSPGTTPIGKYGPLWAYAKAVRFASNEPTTGYVRFSATDWGSLYLPAPSGSAYPTSSSANTPYLATTGNNYTSPSASRLSIAKEHRRVLNVPLLSCPSGAGTPGTVLAIGKFFMTAPATVSSISAEFAGVVPEQLLTGQVELYP